MREKGSNNMEWLDKEEWRREIKEDINKDVETLIFFTYRAELYLYNILGSWVTGN